MGIQQGRVNYMTIAVVLIAALAIVLKPDFWSIFLIVALAVGVLMFIEPVIANLVAASSPAPMMAVP